MNSLRHKDELYETRHVTDLRDLMNSDAERYGDRAAYLVKRAPGSRFIPVSYRQFRSDVTALGTALFDEGYLSAKKDSSINKYSSERKPGAGIRAYRSGWKSGAGGAGGTGGIGIEARKIAIISENSYEYLVAYFAVVCGGGIVVPIDPRLPAAEASNLLQRADAAAAFHSEKYKNAAESARARIPMDEMPSLIEKGERLIKGGDDSYFRVAIDPRQICALLFTSGTTGAAKGVMLSHANLTSNVTGMSAFINAGGMVSLSVLPMHHTLEFTCDILTAMYQGCTVAICEGLRYVMRDLAESKAEVIVGVPLVFEKMHRNIMKTARRAGKYDLLRGLIDFAKLTEGRIPPRILFRSVHKALGGHMKLFLVGGAPCDPGIISDFNAMGIRMIQGYGMTESAPIISVGKDRCSRDASVGLPLHGIFVQIDDADADGVGEIVIAGPSVMSGYYGDEAATKEAMPDGRLRTGDLGRFDEDGFLYIAGRKKNLIVLKNGKNVYPEEVEYYLLRSRYIEEAVVSGAGSKLPGANDTLAEAGGRLPETNDKLPGAGGSAVVCAEIFPDFDTVERDFGKADDDDICKIIDREVDRANESMPPHMRVRRITLRKEPFEKTTTKKIRRKNTS